MNLLAVLAQLVASVAFAATLEVPQPIVITDVPTVYPVEVTAPFVPEKKVVLKKPVTNTKDCSEYSSLIEGYDWPVETAMQICRDESHGNTEAKNWKDKHYDRNGNFICISSQGLFAVACFWPAALGYTMEDLLIPEKNVAMAYLIWSKYGFQPWTTYDS